MDFLIEDSYLGVVFQIRNGRARDWFNGHIKYALAQVQNDGSIVFDCHMAPMILQLIVYYGFKVEINGTPRSRK